MGLAARLPARARLVVRMPVPTGRHRHSEDPRTPNVVRLPDNPASTCVQLKSGTRLDRLRRVSPSIVLLAVIFSTPPAAVAIWSISRTLSRMSNPCVLWGSRGGPEWSASLGPNDPCTSIAVQGESKLRAATIGALVPGGAPECCAGNDRRHCLPSAANTDSAPPESTGQFRAIIHAP